jgi:hypothetical protein
VFSIQLNGTTYSNERIITEHRYEYIHIVMNTVHMSSYDPYCIYTNSRLYSPFVDMTSLRKANWEHS